MSERLCDDYLYAPLIRSAVGMPAARVSGFPVR